MNSSGWRHLQIYQISIYLFNDTEWIIIYGITYFFVLNVVGLRQIVLVFFFFLYFTIAIQTNIFMNINCSLICILFLVNNYTGNKSVCLSQLIRVMTFKYVDFCILPTCFFFVKIRFVLLLNDNKISLDVKKLPLKWPKSLSSFLIALLLLKHHVYVPYGPIGWHINVKLNSNVVIGKGPKVKSTKKWKIFWYVFCLFVLLIN